MGKTIIKPYQSAARSPGTGPSPPRSSARVDGYNFDGADIPSNNSLKSHFSMYLKDALWLRVECKNFTATGFGSDYLPGDRYIGCVSSYNGRSGH